jgi:hypothetical protein
MQDLLELNPKHEKRLKELFYRCLDNGMPKDEAFKEMYRLFFEDENNWLTLDKETV